MPANDVFQRVEKKYLLTTDKYQMLMQCIEPYITADHYGPYTICNLYYDTVHDDLISRSIQKPKYKEKLRLRSYGVPELEDAVFLEIKKKYKGTVYKRRASMTLEAAKGYLEQGIRPRTNEQIMNEIDYFIGFYRPVPKLYLAYDRSAFFGAGEGHLRITFDQHIRSRTHDLQLEAGDHGISFWDKEYYLMEIKVSAPAFPLWLVRILSELMIYPMSFSKYGNIFEQSLVEDRKASQCLQAY